MNSEIPTKPSDPTVESIKERIKKLESKLEEEKENLRSKYSHRPSTVWHILKSAQKIVDGTTKAALRRFNEEFSEEALQFLGIGFLTHENWGWYGLNETVRVLKEEIRVQNLRIEDLEREIKKKG